MVTTVILTGEEAKQRYLKGESLRGATIEGDLRLDGAIIKRDLVLTETTINGGLVLERATIKRSLRLDRVTIEGYLNLTRATIKGNLYLATEKGPSRILVLPEMAELVHWSAPTIPLVVMRTAKT